MSPTNKVQTRRVHTHWLVIEVCERNVCVNEVSARRVKSLPWRKGVTSSVPLRRFVCRLEWRRSSREIDESKSDVINTVGVPQIQYIVRAVDILGIRLERWCFLLSRKACAVFLKPVTSQASKLGWIHPWIGNRDSE